MPAHVGDAAEAWEKVARKLRTREMPPPGRPRPDDATYAAAAAALEAALDAASCRQTQSGTRPGPSAEPDRVYQRDPRSARARGRRPIAAAGRRAGPPGLRQRRQRPVGLTRAAGELPVRGVDGQPPRHRRSHDQSGRRHIQDSHRAGAGRSHSDEALPFGSRGGTAIRYLFPLDGEYSIKVVLKRQLYLYLMGMGEPHQIDVRLDGVLIKRFTVGGEGKGLTAPESFAGNTQGDPDWEVYMHTADAGPRGARPGEGGHARGRRLVREEIPGAGRHPAAAAARLCPDHERALLRRAGGGLGPDRRSVPGSRRGRHAEPPQGVRLPAHQPRRRGAVREENSLDACPPRLSPAGHRRGGPDAARVLQGRAEPRAASMPASSEASGESWPRRAFCSGSNASRRTSAPGTPYRLTDIDLASRLSFFLWSSIPDDELLDAAVARQAPGSGGDGAAGPADARAIRARRRWSTISPTSG